MSAGGVIDIDKAGMAIAHALLRAAGDVNDAQRQAIDTMLRERRLQRTAVAGDGNCMFRALELGRVDNDVDHRYARLRTAETVCDRALRRLFAPLVAAMYPGQDVEQYAARIRRDGEWGDHIDLFAYGHYYGVSITVHQVGQLPLLVHQGRPDRRHLHVAYTGLNHYDVARPLPLPPPLPPRPSRPPQPQPSQPAPASSPAAGKRRLLSPSASASSSSSKRSRASSRAGHRHRSRSRRHSRSRSRSHSRGKEEKKERPRREKTVSRSASSSQPAAADDGDDGEQRVITLSLSGLLCQPPPTQDRDGVAVSLLDGQTEQGRRHFVAQHVIRYAGQTAAQIGLLASFLMSLYLLDLVENDLAVPLILSDRSRTLMWDECHRLCSVDSSPPQQPQRGRQGQPSAPVAAAAASSRSAQQQLVHQRLVSELSGRDIIRADLKKVRDEQLSPLLQLANDWQWPDRAGLSNILKHHSLQRRTAFNNLYGMNFNARQLKVIRNQVLDMQLYREFRDVSATAAARAAGRVPAIIRRSAQAVKQGADEWCTRLLLLGRTWVRARVNRWPLEPSGFDEQWKAHGLGDNTAARLAAREQLEALIKEHQAGFGRRSVLSDGAYWLSADDAMQHGAAYVQYFAYLSKQYDRFRLQVVNFNLLRQQAAQQAAAAQPQQPQQQQQQPRPRRGRGRRRQIAGQHAQRLDIDWRWEAFPVIPQLQQRLHFIDLSADNVVNLAKVSRTASCQAYVRAHLPGRHRDGAVVVNAVNANPTIDWLGRSAEDVVRRPVTTTPLRLLFNFSVIERLLRAGDRSKYERREFGQLISTDGQQVKIHYKAVPRQRERQQSTGPASSSSSSSSSGSHISSSSSETKLQLQKDDSGHYVSAEEFRGWIGGKKTIAATDPGHKNVVTTVRFHRDSDLSAAEWPIPLLPPDPPPAPIPAGVAADPAQLQQHRRLLARLRRRRRRYLARAQRRAEAKQTVYSLTNGRWHHLAGHHNAADTRRRWRQKANLTDMDAYLKANHATCNRRTFSIDVYKGYLRYLFAPQPVSPAETTQRRATLPPVNSPPVPTWWKRQWAEVSQSKHGKLRFWCFQRQQHAYGTIAAEMCGGRDRIKHTVVLWGSGSFGPTLRRYAAAPNQRLRRGLAAHGVEIHLCNERYTSKLTGCCQRWSFFPKMEQERKVRPRLARRAAPAQQQQPSLPLSLAPALAQQQQQQPQQQPARAPRRRVSGMLWCQSPLPHTQPDHYLACHLPPSDRPAHRRVYGYAAPSSQVAVSDSAHSPHSPQHQPNDKHEHRHSRPWNRDVSAAINIYLKQYLHAFGPDQLPDRWGRQQVVSGGGGT